MALVDFAARTVRTKKPNDCWSSDHPARVLKLPHGGGAVLSYDEDLDCAPTPAHVIATYDNHLTRTSVTRIPYCE